MQKDTNPHEMKEDPSTENQGLGEGKNGVGEGRDPIKNQEMIFCGQPPAKNSQGGKGGENETKTKT